MTTPVYKLTVYVVDHDGLGIDNVISELENSLDAGVTVASEYAEAEVEWHDDIDINFTAKQDEAFKKLFSE